MRGRSEDGVLNTRGCSRRRVGGIIKIIYDLNSATAPPYLARRGRGQRHGRQHRHMRGEQQGAAVIPSAWGRTLINIDGGGQAC